MFGGEVQLWIGARETEKEGCWAWTDGSPWFYATWMPNEPNDGGTRWAAYGEACGTLSETNVGDFNDINCNDYTGLAPSAPWVDGWVCKKIGTNIL